ncbi:hypothetical protein COCNU_01G016020 [Cocos nucifera]|uniref:Uncharacterized protein n=1 Tax=Cocos nucifera TaxID=13894 RepID=A0A8K0HWQ5_COCNU|nr:hypothetical protein COCNU_01G016020 [Cocos nucifera]
MGPTASADLGRGSLDGWEVVRSLVEGCILLDIIKRMLRSDDEERMRNSYMAFIELGQHLFTNLEAINLHKTEISRAIKEAKTIQTEAKNARAESECLREAHSTEVGHLQEVLKKEEQVSAILKTTLALEEEKRKKAEVEVGTKGERAIKSFRSSKEMEDIKVVFAQEAFDKGFELY